MVAVQENDLAAEFFESFRTELRAGGAIANLRAGVIGEGAEFAGPFGRRRLIYADYVASGRALRQLEARILDSVLPYYANSHTEASFCGMYMTRLRNAARAVIAAQMEAGADCAILFCGAGATAGLNRLVELLGVAASARRGERPLVLVGPYEHHSNLLPWRECGAEIVEITEGKTGGPDPAALEAALAGVAPGRLCIGSFSAASNVTGILTDVTAVTRILKRRGALSIWDYAGGGPYLPLSMQPAPDCPIDAIVLSPHKFLGGPGASGVLAVRRGVVRSQRPSQPGGGTVSFVSPWGHDYSCRIEAREEAGTPNVIGDIRAALAFLVKEAIGQAHMEERHRELNRRALSRWSKNPNMELLGADRPNRLPIFAFRIRDPKRGGHVHHQLFTRMLSDAFGIQARGGCACAGPYAHRLLGIDQERSEMLRAAIRTGAELEKPGWVRLNFSALMDDAKADHIIQCVDSLARNPYPLAELYACDPATARFKPAAA